MKVIKKIVCIPALIMLYSTLLIWWTADSNNLKLAKAINDLMTDIQTWGEA